MAKSAAVKIEVRWRETGTEQWSDIQSCNPAAQIVVEGLDRTKTYDFEWRGVSACGARSAWGSTSHSILDAPPGTLRLDDIKTEVDNAAADALAANQELANIASDNVLSQGEKPLVIRDTNVITTEQAGIDAQATAYGITTEKTTYDSAVTALTTYLATLTTPTLWSDLSGDTTVVGTTFRSKFADVYTTRQALLNAIYAAAKTKADAAQATADLAQSNLYIIDPNFIQGINYWAVDYFPGGWYGETGLVSPSPVIPTYVVHAGSTLAANTNHIATTALRNTGFGAVKAGHVISASALIRPTGGPDGSADVRISWRNSSQAEISVARGNQITNATGTGMSRVTATAPSGAVYAHIEVGAYSHTVGYYAYTGCDWNYQPNSLDEVPNSATYLKSLARTQGLVENGDFEVGDASTFPPPGWQLGAVIVGGGSVSSQHYDTSTQYSGSRSLAFSAAQYNGYESIRSYQVTPGDYYAIGGWVVGTGAIFALYFLNTSNAVTGSIAINSGGYQTATGKVPAGSVYAKLILSNFSAGTNTVEFDALFMARCSSYDNALAISGSGQRLGDLRNQVMVGVGNYASGWSGGSISYSASSTSATLSVSSATLQIGGQSLAYNASSTTVSGSAGSTVKYYLYYDDPSFTGGSKTLNATTSQITALSNDGRVLVGSVSVTYPTSGTGSGGGGTGCPDENAWVLRADPEGRQPDWCVLAREVEVGHLLRLTDGRAGLVTHSERKPAQRIRVFDENAATLTCSTSAPLELAGTSGECVLAPDAAGHRIKAMADGVQFDPIVWKVEPAGPGYVQHITCQNACFWTGDDPDYLFAHHNLKPGL
ncbi:hypothetical protein [Dyella sp.]|uniref:hypothetical protein n=1 Tax=Dyella sp. TaxID=1869338 RepID=UPI003F7E5B9D